MRPHQQLVHEAENFTVKMQICFFSLPRETTQLFVANVYIHLRANANVAVRRLHDNISKQQNKHLEGWRL